MKFGHVGSKQADFTILCTDSKWYDYLAWDVITILIYPVGVPAFFFYLLWKVHGGCSAMPLCVGSVPQWLSLVHARSNRTHAYLSPRFSSMHPPLLLLLSVFACRGACLIDLSLFP